MIDLRDLERFSYDIVGYSETDQRGSVELSMNRYQFAVLGIEEDACKSVVAMI